MTLLPTPTATSSMRTSPTRQPTGAIRLKGMVINTVNAACPTTNPIALAA
jgi:hypothetical protein